MPESTAVIGAIEANLQASFASFLCLPNAVGTESAHLASVVTDVPVSFFNGIAYARLAAPDLNAQIDAALAPFRSRSVPMRWWISPATRPIDLGAHLEGLGLRHAADAIGMAIELADVKPVPVPHNLRIERVRTLAALQRWIHCFASCFGISTAAAQHWLDVYSHVGFDPAAPWRQYVGMIDDEPVATSSLLRGAGMPGIYHVRTRPSWRGRGIGAAMTLAPLREAREHSHQFAVLQSSAMGEPVYQRLGFKAYCQLRRYDWVPSGPP